MSSEDTLGGRGKNERERETEDLIERIRREASEVKDCFTRFSFQAIAFAGPALALIAGLALKITPDGATAPEMAEFGGLVIVALATAAVISLLLAVARIGTYKYGTANRNLGYELHLERTRPESPVKAKGNENQDASKIIAWCDMYRAVGWEEALFAWRIVQATVFDFVHKSPTGWRFRWINNRVVRFLDLAPDILNKDGLGGDARLWFAPNSLIERPATYYAGSYLQTMLLILHALAMVSFSPLAFSLWRVRTSCAEFWTGMVVLFFGILFVLLKFQVNTKRREILEEGLLSIYSCARMWQVVIVAHYRAQHAARKSANLYVKELAEEAVFVRSNILRIDRYVGGELVRPEAPVHGKN
jgi:hypothetical protein